MLPGQIRTTQAPLDSPALVRYAPDQQGMPSTPPARPPILYLRVFSSQPACKIIPTGPSHSLQEPGSIPPTVTTQVSSSSCEHMCGSPLSRARCPVSLRMRVPPSAIGGDQNNRTGCFRASVLVGVQVGRWGGSNK